MAYLNFTCDACQLDFDEFAASGQQINCPQCGQPARRSFSGRCHGGIGKTTGCGGNCSCCAGCGGGKTAKTKE